MSSAIILPLSAIQSHDPLSLNSTGCKAYPFANNLSSLSDDSGTYSSSVMTQPNKIVQVRPGRGKISGGSIRGRGYYKMFPGGDRRWVNTHHGERKEITPLENRPDVANDNPNYFANKAHNEKNHAQRDSANANKQERLYDQMRVYQPMQRPHRPQNLIRRKPKRVSRSKYFG